MAAFIKEPRNAFSREQVGGRVKRIALVAGGADRAALSFERVYGLPHGSPRHAAQRGKSLARNNAAVILQRSEHALFC